MRDDTRPPRDGKDPSPVRALRLVHPSPPTPSKPQHPPTRSTFTPEEQSRLRAALRHARRLFGTWACLADAMYVTGRRLRRQAAGDRRLTEQVAVRLARALGKPLESLYAAPSDASRCPTCGASRGSP